MIEQIKTKPQETHDFKMNKQMETFSSSPPIHLSEEGKWLMAVNSFSATNSVFNINDENNSFSTSTRPHWSPEDGGDIINKLKILIELRFENDSKLHVKEVEKRGTRIKTENSG